MNINKLRFHCSHISHLLSTIKDNRPITDRQFEEMTRLLDKDKLTEAQTQKLKYYVQKETNYNPKELSKMVKADMVKMYAWQKYRKCQVSLGGWESMALEKGTIAENESIKLLSEIDGIKYEKCTRTYKNPYLIGKPDIVIKTPKLKVIDIKSSVDIVSFLSRIERQLNHEYIMQMQGYL